MKKVTVLFLCLFMTRAVSAQVDTIQPPYKKFPSFPPIKLLMPDSSSYYTKEDLPRKKAIMLMIFNPQCEHCQHETEELVKNIDKFKDIQIIMSTSMLFDSMMSFRRRYQLDKYDNIIVGQDRGFFLISYFMLRNMPFLAFYDKKKQLISVFEGSLPIPGILEIFKGKE